MMIREYLPPTDDELWVEASPFVLPDPVSDHPWLWRLVGPFVVRWKHYEESQMPRYDWGARSMISCAGWMFRHVVGRFSNCATRHDYFWAFMCPHCSYDCDWVLEDMERWNQNYWYRTTDEGKSFNGEYTCHWFEGIVTCPRCLKEWPYGDSD